MAARIDIVQIRERDLTDIALTKIVSDAVDAARGSSTRVVVNDRLDIAVACGAAGVHLRGDSPPTHLVRAHAPAGFLIGRSVRSVAEAVRSVSSVDYLIAGTVWPSASKPENAELLGQDGLAEIVGAVEVPVLAIGGVNLDRIPALASSGAAGLAAIGVFLDLDREGCRAVGLDAIAEEARSRFDRRDYH